MRSKKYLSVCLVLSMLIPSSIFAWGPATHAYFSDQLGKSRGYYNLQEIYGSMAPDLVNPFTGSSYFEFFRLQTHYQFDKVVNKASTRGMKAFAYGFTSHNEVWGADYTAHRDGRTTPGIGYVSAQVASLTPAFEDSLEQLLLNNNVDPAQAKEIATEFAPSVAHVAVEIAADILIKRNEDPGIGKKILQAAQFRSPAVPALLVAAYAGDFASEFDMNYWAASGIIVAAEIAHKEYISYYGYVLTKKESEIMQLLSDYAAKLAELYMKTVKNMDITIPVETATHLIALAMTHVESSYADEVAATLAYLETEMPLHDVNSKRLPIALESETKVEGEFPPVPYTFSLAQNQPNPFNPTTKINYSLAKDSHVRITVYNALGQVIAVLADGYQSAGAHTVTWNAHDKPSGFYIYRLEANGFAASKKMFFQK